MHYEEWGTAENRVAFMVWDGSVWGNSFENVINDSLETRQFDVAYEENSGRAMAVYAVGAKAYFRIWDGSTWSAEAEVGGIGTAGTILWVKLASKRNDNHIVLLTTDSGHDLNATIWNGTTWGDNIVLETDVSDATQATANATALDAVWLASGKLMVAWGDEASPVQSRI